MEKQHLLSEMKQAMLLHIPNAVKKVNRSDSDEVCYISLLGTDYEPVLGLITLGIQSYRDEMLKEEKEQKRWVLWNSAEMPAQYQVGLEKVSPSFQEYQEKFMEVILKEKGLA